MAGNDAPDRRGGFTLMELVVVLAILSVAAAMAAPTFGQSMAKLRLKTAGRSLAAAFRFARMTAVTEKIPCVVAMDLENEAYRVDYDPEALNSTEFIETPPSPIPPSRSARRTLEGGLDLKTATLPGGKVIDRDEARIGFRPDGSSDGGEIELQDAGGRRLTVKILPSTGAVKIADVREKAR